MILLCDSRHIVISFLCCYPQSMFSLALSLCYLSRVHNGFLTGSQWHIVGTSLAHRWPFHSYSLHPCPSVSSVGHIFPLIALINTDISCFREIRARPWLDYLPLGQLPSSYRVVVHKNRKQLAGDYIHVKHAIGHGWVQRSSTVPPVLTTEFVGSFETDRLRLTMVYRHTQGGWAYLRGECCYLCHPQGLDEKAIGRMHSHYLVQNLSRDM